MTMLCPHCAQAQTKAGHDPCIADLPGVFFACCGHNGGGDYGNEFDQGFAIPYLTEKGKTFYGVPAVNRMRELGGDPPDVSDYMRGFIAAFTAAREGVAGDGWIVQANDVVVTTDGGTKWQKSLKR